jgi:hypothetical protein
MPANSNGEREIGSPLFLTEKTACSEAVFEEAATRQCERTEIALLEPSDEGPSSPGEVEGFDEPRRGASRLRHSMVRGPFAHIVKTT